MARMPLFAAPDALPYPALYASHAGIWIAEEGEDARQIDRRDAIRVAADTPVILLNAPMLGARLCPLD